MSRSPAASRISPAAIAAPLRNEGIIYGSSHEPSFGADDNGIIHSLKIPRRTSIPAQRPSSSTIEPKDASTSKTIAISGQGLQASRTDTQRTASKDVFDKASSPDSSTSLYPSSASNNTSPLVQDPSPPECNKRLAPLAALKREAASSTSSVSSSTSSSSNLSRRGRHRQERAEFEISRARIWANSTHTTSRYELTSSESQHQYSQLADTSAAFRTNSVSDHKNWSNTTGEGCRLPRI